MPPRSRKLSLQAPAKLLEPDLAAEQSHLLTWTVSLMFNNAVTVLWFLPLESNGLPCQRLENHPLSRFQCRAPIWMGPAGAQTLTPPLAHTDPHAFSP